MTGTTGVAAQPAAAHAATYRVEVVEGADALLDRVRSLAAAVQSGTHQATVFQSAPWLAAIHRAILRHGRAELFGLAVTEAASGTLAMLLPLMVRQEGRIRVIRFVDFEMSDYRAPILGPAAPHDAAAQRALWQSVRRALRRRADVIRLEALPGDIGGRANPLAMLPAATRSRLTGMWVGVETTVEDFLRSRGKKYRKEAERCFRLLEKEGTPLFRRADTPEAIERAYAALEAQQSQRHGDAGNEFYVLDQPQYSEFYRDLLLSERDSDFAHIFTLEVEGRIVAALLGVTHGGTFTLLRISNGGQLWRHLSPGRLVVLEAMRFMVARGVRLFDMGAGDYPFKRGFGAAEIPLHDLVAALSVRGLPALAAERAKAWLKRHPGLLQAARRLRGRG